MVWLFKAVSRVVRLHKWGGTLVLPIILIAITPIYGFAEEEFSEDTALDEALCNDGALLTEHSCKYESSMAGGPSTNCGSPTCRYSSGKYICKVTADDPSCKCKVKLLTTDCPAPEFKPDLSMLTDLKNECLNFDISSGAPATLNAMCGKYGFSTSEPAPVYEASNRSELQARLEATLACRRSTANCNCEDVCAKFSPFAPSGKPLGHPNNAPVLDSQKILCCSPRDISLPVESEHKDATEDNSISEMSY